MCDCDDPGARVLLRRLERRLGVSADRLEAAVENLIAGHNVMVSMLKTAESAEQAREVPMSSASNHPTLSAQRTMAERARRA